MTIDTPILASTAQTAVTDAAATRHRDANTTRQLLLESARRRFARDGYSSTTVRDIAADAGVNVALINRYFTSKEGLFEECLTLAAKHLENRDNEGMPLERIAATMLRQLADSSGEPPLQLLLLLRTSGDVKADAIRRDTLRSFAERMALATAGAGEVTEELVLRAEIAIAAGLGIALLRTTTTLEPLASATEADLSGPITDLFSALLAPAAPLVE